MGRLIKQWLANAHKKRASNPQEVALITMFEGSLGGDAVKQVLHGVSRFTGIRTNTNKSQLSVELHKKQQRQLLEVEKKKR